LITPPNLLSYILERFNTRAASMLCAFVLICAGIYMCLAGLSASGSINVKAAVLEGKIETGSLGLLAMFLGALIVLAMNIRYGNQEIKLSVNGNEITGRGLSYRQVRELVEAAISSKGEEKPKAAGQH
jgi:hypothetical protein